MESTQESNRPSQSLFSSDAFPRNSFLQRAILLSLLTPLSSIYLELDAAAVALDGLLRLSVDPTLANTEEHFTP